jgi:hypothetical protein
MRLTVSRKRPAPDEQQMKNYLHCQNYYIFPTGTDHGIPCRNPAPGCCFHGATAPNSPSAIIDHGLSGSGWSPRQLYQPALFPVARATTNDNNNSNNNSTTTTTTTGFVSFTTPPIPIRNNSAAAVVVIVAVSGAARSAPAKGDHAGGSRSRRGRGDRSADPQVPAPLPAGPQRGNHRGRIEGRLGGADCQGEYVVASSSESVRCRQACSAAAAAGRRF